ncbi:fimbria/pilus periplasmic chaperone [Stenotrophomonas sp. CFBP 13724]|jgi:chaperone protein EcpD|uniref:fimbrial biogenesis chaperone n=1 Tax=Stenotrophomonas sp. CFBP 13724 TaxID=2775298 RepID=UPI0005AED59C|nr:fimbria/pilus periplasmic chaperone [Stenotrophomonas sp. CFBP 13724]KIP84154.1 hypothetical protein SN15_12155 [Stenotrophomonas maltophilia]MBD8642032.1 fimbria/pilus periplasmic chaperone [Stenotrophomonas sp. CFBP 13724]
MNLIRTGLLCCVAVASLLASVSADAGVIVHGTRQIFPGNQREITVRIENVGQKASLVQAWTDAGDKLAAPEESVTPFVLRPPVFRLDGGKSQSLRILFTGGDLPQDRESIYYLNVLDIPPVPQDGEIATGNYLQFSLRTRIKLIYRPNGLDDAGTAPQKLQWSLVPDAKGWALQATNPTPYYVHVGTLGLRVQGVDHPAVDPQMIAPQSTERYALDSLRARPNGGNVQFQYINDFGASVGQSVPLSGN